MSVAVERPISFMGSYLQPSRLDQHALQRMAREYVLSCQLFTDQHPFLGKFLASGVNYFALAAKDSDHYLSTEAALSDFSLSVRREWFGRNRVATAELLNPISFYPFGETPFLLVVEPQSGERPHFNGLRYAAFHQASLDPVMRLLSKSFYLEFELIGDTGIAIPINPGQEIRLTSETLSAQVRQSEADGRSILVAGFGHRL